MIYEADFRHAIKNEPLPQLTKMIVEELTDRELYELTTKLFNAMDSTYQSEFEGNTR